jgi:peptidoglycan/xylan/chitin deacetylase (PgdA/CDA1 family)
LKDIPEDHEMTTWREFAIEAGMGFFRASGAHRLAEPYTRGLGAILMFHNVGDHPATRDFAPNQGLEISADFLDELLEHLRHRGIRIISLDDALAEVQKGETDSAPFVVLTFDDGYRDLVDHALPVLERHQAPFTAYVTSGFAEGSARLWWAEMEEAFRRLDRIDVIAGGRRLNAGCATAAEKNAAFAELYWLLRSGGEDDLLRVALALCAEARIDPRKLTTDLCLDWKGLEPLAAHELATIGAHSVTHARLAKLDADAAIKEMKESRAAIARELGVEARHFCYPVGDATSAGRREFDLARGLGFASAVTTRPGTLFPEHAEHLHALPRLSVNGKHQSLKEFDILLSGAPFALMNKGRRVMAA